MALIFGLDVPIIHLLVIFLVLLGAGLALVWLELKRLRELIIEEKSVVRQFEKDLERLEGSEGKTHNSELETYVTSALARGATPEQVEAVLRGRGWNKEVVEKVLDNVVGD